MDTTDPHYRMRRGQVAHYFDRTAARAWEHLTSDVPVGGIRATVRAGREAMRCTLVGWLPADLRGQRVLDAGCGTGSAAVDLARRGAHVVAVDLSPTLVAVARSRLPADLGPGSLELLAGDMLDPSLGRFDHVLSMDALIHYDAATMVGALGALAARTRGSIVFSFAPGNALLRAMMAVGRLFPRGNRSPAIHPVAPRRLHAQLAAAAGLQGWSAGRTERVAHGFYQSQALELVAGDRA